MSSLDAETTIKDLMSHLKTLAPKLRPQLLPSQFSNYAVSILDACSNDSQRAAMVSYLASHGMDEEGIVLRTKVDYNQRKVWVCSIRRISNPLDARLQSLEQMMKAFVTGNKDELAVLNKRFLQVNKLNGDSYDTSVSSSSSSSRIVLLYVNHFFILIDFISVHFILFNTYRNIDASRGMHVGLLGESDIE